MTNDDLLAIRQKLAARNRLKTATRIAREYPCTVATVLSVLEDVLDDEQDARACIDAALAHGWWAGSVSGDLRELRKHSKGT